MDEQEKRLNNGMTLEVVSVSKKGKIVLKNKASKSTFHLDKDFGHLSHAHCITSHASQGKTVDEVFIAQPSATFPATDARQFYVSVSRARDSARIYTDDRVALLDYASELGNRQSAIELVSNKNSHLDYVHQLQRDGYSKVEKPTMEKADNPIINRDKYIDYEPEFLNSNMMRWREGDPTKEGAQSDHRVKAYDESYPEESHARNICFVWLDGKRIFMNYSYLVSGEYSPEESIITLTFSTSTFILKGVNLESLFYDIMQQVSRQITCADTRYNLIGESEQFVVNEIIVMKDA